MQFIHCWWEHKLVQPPWKAVCRFLKKLKIELSYNPVIPLLGIYLKECKLGYNRDTCTPMFIAAVFTTAKLWKQLRSPKTDEWIKCIYIYTHTNIYIYIECYSSIKKNESMLFAVNGWN
jgi:hypothetical protein